MKIEYSQDHQILYDRSIAKAFVLFLVTALLCLYCFVESLFDTLVQQERAVKWKDKDSATV